MSTVLVIDDDITFLDSMQKLLSHQGYEVLRAGDGTQAMKLIEEFRERIDLAVVDLALPGVNGFEILGAVTRRPNRVKLIATTAVYRNSQLEIAGTLGAHAVIRKPPPGSPLPEAEWLAVVRKLIGVPARGRAARANSLEGNTPENPHGNEPRQ